MPSDGSWIWAVSTCSYVLLETANAKADSSVYGMCIYIYTWDYWLRVDNVQCLIRRIRRSSLRWSWRLGNDYYGWTDLWCTHICDGWEVSGIWDVGDILFHPGTSICTVFGANITLPCLQFSYHDGVREACARWVPLLFDYFYVWIS